MSGGSPNDVTVNVNALREEVKNKYVRLQSIRVVITTSMPVAILPSILDTTRILSPRCQTRLWNLLPV
jgi:hypothetical protein